MKYVIAHFIIGFLGTCWLALIDSEDWVSPFPFLTGVASGPLVLIAVAWKKYGQAGLVICLLILALGVVGAIE